MSIMIVHVQCTCKFIVDNVEIGKESILTSSRREYYIFSGPPCGENSDKFLAINNFSVNEPKSGQPNKHLFSLTFRELNGYFLLLRSSFFCTITR